MSQENNNHRILCDQLSNRLESHDFPYYRVYRVHNLHMCQYLQHKSSKRVLALKKLPKKTTVRRLSVVYLPEQNSTREGLLLLALKLVRGDNTSRWHSYG